MTIIPLQCRIKPVYLALREKHGSYHHLHLQNQEKTLTFSYEKHHNIHKAVDEAEGIDQTDFLKMEMQLEAISDTKSVRNFRDNHFKSSVSVSSHYNLKRILV